MRVEGRFSDLQNEPACGSAWRPTAALQNEPACREQHPMDGRIGFAKRTRGGQNEMDEGGGSVFGFTKRTRQCVCPGSMLGRSGICPTGLERTYKTNPPAANKLASTGNLGRRFFRFSSSVIVDFKR
jgi:hypothetical protein